MAIRKAEVSTRYLIECKHPTTDTKIGISPVRQLYAVKVDEKATKAILATTSYFTKEARLFFERHSWELEPRDYDGVLEWINTYVKQRDQRGSARCVAHRMLNRGCPILAFRPAAEHETCVGMIGNCAAI